MKQYYIYDNNQQHGPYTMDQLRAMPLRPDMLVWYEGLAQWMRCDQVQELQVIFPPAPPTMQPAMPPVVQPQMAIPVMQVYQPPVKKKSVVGKVLATIVVLVIAVSLGALYIDSISSSSSYGSGSSSPQQTRKDLEAANPFDYLSVTGSWEYDFLTKKRILADINVSNRAIETAYSGIIIKVQQYSDSDVLLGESNHRLSSIVYPGTSKSNRLKVTVDRSAKKFNFSVIDADAYVE